MSACRKKTELTGSGQKPKRMSPSPTKNCACGKRYRPPVWSKWVCEAMTWVTSEVLYPSAPSWASSARSGGKCRPSMSLSGP